MKTMRKMNNSKVVILMQTEFYNTLYKTLYEKLVNLASVAGIDVAVLQKYFVPEGNPTSKSILFRLCSSLENSGMMRNSIKFDKDITNSNAIKKVLFDFDTKRSAATYPDWRSIYDAMLAAGIKDNGNRENNETNWEKYCRGLYDALQFLTINNGEKKIKDLVAASKLTDMELKEISAISREIHGLGFVLTCDWLKECGCTWLAKPDVHIKGVVKYIQGNEKLKDEDVLKLMFTWAEAVKNSGADKYATAYKIDKIIWLLCTGEFYLDDRKIGRKVIYRIIDSLR